MESWQPVWMDSLNIWFIFDCLLDVLDVCENERGGAENSAAWII